MNEELFSALVEVMKMSAPVREWQEYVAYYKKCEGAEKFLADAEATLTVHKKAFKAAGERFIKAFNKIYGEEATA